MNFAQALKEVINQRQNDEEMLNPFIVYSKLGDLCGASFENKPKIDLFYKVDSKLNLIWKLLQDKNYSCEEYFLVEDILNESSFCSLINIVKGIIYPDTILKVSVKPLPNKQVVKVEHVQEVEEPRTPLSNPQNTNYSSDFDVTIALILMGVFVLVGGIFVTLALVFNWSWLAWQWIIGIFGGINFSFILVWVVARLEDEVIVDFYLLGSIILGVCLLLNFTLQLIFKSNYKIIFSCLSIIEIVWGIILCICTLGDIEDEWGLVQIGEIVFAIILMIIGLIWL